MKVVPPEQDPVAAVATLGEPLRRRIYDHAASEAGGVSRDGVAEALALPRSVAAFHLDKLAQAGLLEVEYRRPPGRGGPGAGRPAKWYRRGGGEVTVSLPERRYNLAASILAEAVERAAGGEVPVATAVAEVARQHGRQIGSTVRWGGGRSGTPARVLAQLLASYGYQPRVAGRQITLGNCPFHALAESHRELVCGMNLELLNGLLEAAGLPAGRARLDPSPDGCCVTLMTN
ncbi:MAG: helix-turn-helix transcriptional regulator [Acidimicrobiales bacterium]